MYDDPNSELPNEQPWEPPPVETPWHGGGGQGVWAPGYEPGSNWNGGNAPTDPYNGGSPPDQALNPGSGWTFSGPQTPMWNMTNNSWDTGSWNQTPGSGLGYTAPAAPPPPNPGGTPPPIRQTGAVAPMPAGGGSQISAPGSNLPQNIQNLFNQVPAQTSVQSAYQTALLQYLAQAQQTPTLDDPHLSGQVEVFRAANQRNAERQRRTAVERASSTGQGNSGYIDNQIKKTVADQGFNTADFNSKLLGGEMIRKRNELGAALHLAQTTGDAEAEREIRTRLAQVSAMMQQQGLNLQAQLGQGDLDIRWAGLGANTAMGLEGLNQHALQMIMSGMG